MRFFRLVFVFSFFVCSLNRLQAQVSIFAGPQITSANYSIRNAHQATSVKPAFSAGIRLTSKVEGPVYFAPSLSYSQKGYKVIFDRPAAPPDSAAQNNNASLRTIAFDLLLQFNLSKKAAHWFVRIGPGIDAALSGNEIFDSTGGKRVNRSMLFGSTGYSPATAYANLQVGFQSKTGFSVFTHYEHGLSNLNNSDGGPMILHRVVGLSVGWNLGRN